MGLLTCSKPIGDDAGTFFNMISGIFRAVTLEQTYSCTSMAKKKTEEMIEREIKHAKEGRKARIVAEG